MRNPIRSSAARAAVACTVMLLTACASTGPATDTDIVRQRAEARWKAVVSNDWQAAYGYLAPSFRALMTAERYRASIGNVVQYLGATVSSAECEPERCRVVVDVENRPLVVRTMRGSMTSQLEETWIKENGQWWLFQKL